MSEANGSEPWPWTASPGGAASSYKWVGGVDMRFRKIPHEPEATYCGFRASQDLPEAEPHVHPAKPTSSTDLSFVNEVVNQAGFANVDRHGNEHGAFDGLNGLD